MNVRFRIIRILENHIVSGDCDLEMDIDISPSADPAQAKNRLKSMKLWMDKFLDGCVAFGVNTEVDTTFLEQISNNVMMCPDDPHDYLLTILIHSKLSAIGAGDIRISRTKLMTDAGEGFSNTVEGTAEEWLPNIEEWMGPRYFWSAPWWNRADSSMTDLIPAADDDLEKKPELGFDLMALVSGNQRSKEAGEQTPAEIIRPTFTPRVLTPDE